MNLANAVSASRIVFSPIFFVVAFLPRWVPGRFALFSTVVVWVLFVLIELTDLADGMIARSSGTVSDFGKILDPFADVISRLTYFAVFASFLIMPMWMFVLIMYRETSIIFIRAMLIRDGVTLAARPGGKAKAVIYAISSAIGLAVLMNQRLGTLQQFGFVPQWIAFGAFAVAVLFSWGSFIDYLVVVRRHYRDRRV